uniref:Dipeptidylpeptidase IV N-terminal domain-containing protein n=1 Tax=Tetradesmus obliquus TaxID=3088 RepID=A0A383VQ50_TETOB|eukprot:jgi/Sobl393_1/11551/SZX66969.1
MQFWVLTLLFVVAATSTTARQQLRGSNKHQIRARNGLIAYAANTSGTFQIWASNPDGSNPRQLTTAEQGFQLAAHPAWSPDGSRLAFTGMAAGSLNVWIRNADGSLLQLTTSAAPTWISMVPAWTADGQRIIFESNREVPPADSTSDDPYDLYSVDVATGNDIKRLTISVGNRTGGMGGKPSPCGKFLAFASDRGASMPQGLFDLYVVRLGLDGLPAGQPRRLTRGAADQFSRSWSPDSKYLAFNSQVGWTGTAADKVGAGRIMTVKLSSGKLQPLTQPNDRFPAFASGGIFPALRGDVTPAWSPDGSRVAFASQSGPSGAFEVVSVRASDGRDRRVVTSGSTEQHVTVAWQPVLA